MTYKEALDYIFQIAPLGSRPGLERITDLLHRLGDPQEKLRVIHIAGTNGKGSCAAMTASVLRCCGMRTGLFTSPHLLRYNERIQINGKPISNADFAALIGEVRPAADAMEDHPTEFELITAAAYLYFAQQNCAAVVMEVGLGGRLDATNVLTHPAACVIMNIGLDHTELLGDTPELIAAEKAGILKPGCLCVAYDQAESVLAVIRGKCEELGAEFRKADFTKLTSEFDALEGQVFQYKGENYAIALAGAHQLKNAAVVIELTRALRERGWKLDPTDVEHGLYAAAWPARFEVVADEPYFVIDGGHNPQCAEAAAAALAKYFPDRRHVLLIGILADKDRFGMEDILNAQADAYVCVTPNSPRAFAARDLAEELRRFGKPVSAFDDLREGISAAIDAAGKDGMVLCVGSLYMAGEVRAYFIPEKQEENA